MLETFLFQDGATSVFLASQGGSKSILRILIEEAKRRLVRTNSFCRASGSQDAFFLFQSRNFPTFVNASRRDGATPLFIAAQMGHLDCIRTLLFYGAEIDKERAVRQSLTKINHAFYHRFRLDCLEKMETNSFIARKGIALRPLLFLSMSARHMHGHRHAGFFTVPYLLPN